MTQQDLLISIHTHIYIHVCIYMCIFIHVNTSELYEKMSFFSKLKIHKIFKYTSNFT